MFWFGIAVGAAILLSAINDIAGDVRRETRKN